MGSWYKIQGPLKWIQFCLETSATILSLPGLGPNHPHIFLCVCPLCSIINHIQGTIEVFFPQRTSLIWVLNSITSTNFFYLEIKYHHWRLCKGLHKLKELVSQNLSALPCGKRWSCVFELCCGFCPFMSEKCEWRLLLTVAVSKSYQINVKGLQQKTSLLRLFSYGYHDF